MFLCPVIVIALRVMVHGVFPSTYAALLAIIIVIQPLNNPLIPRNQLFIIHASVRIARR